MLYVNSAPYSNTDAFKLQLNRRDADRDMVENSQYPVLTELTRNLALNSGRIPQDVYREFDNVTVTRMRQDDGDAYLNDLLPLSKAVNIGKSVYEYRQASDAGRVQTSMTGQIGVKGDQVEYTYDGTIIPVHDASFYRNWREYNAQRSEGFDALIDDQRETVASVRSAFADDFLNGHRDTDGNIIVLDGHSWGGMKNDTKVAQVDLGAGGLNFDFTDPNNTGREIMAAFIALRDVLSINNNCGSDLTVYVSQTIMSNFELTFFANNDSRSVFEVISGLDQIASIKKTNKLVGNELMMLPLDGGVKPITGMGIATMAMPRPVYNSNYEFVTAHASGWNVVNDFAGRTCALYAADLT